MRVPMRPAITLSLLALVIAGSARAADPTATCTATKLQRAGEYHRCLLDDMARIIRGREARFAKCEAKFVAGWRKAEEKGGAACRTTGDEVAIKGQVAGDVVGIIAALTPSFPTTTTTLVPGGPCGGGATYPSC